jgi:hypothetical protein
MNGFTQLGSNAPKIKTKKFTGAIPNNNSHSVSIDISLLKIISYDVVIQGNYYDGILGEFGSWRHGLFKSGGGNPSGCNYNAFIGGLYSFGDPNFNPLNSYFRFENIGNELRDNNSQYIIYITYEE